MPVFRVIFERTVGVEAVIEAASREEVERAVNAPDCDPSAWLRTTWDDDWEQASISEVRDPPLLRETRVTRPDYGALDGRLLPVAEYRAEVARRAKLDAAIAARPDLSPEEAERFAWPEAPGQGTLPGTECNKGEAGV